MIFRHLLLSIFMIGLCQIGNAQEKTISLRKGQALDLLLLTTNPEAREKQTEYFEAAVSVAQEYGYTPKFSSRISEPPTQGNYWPELFILATWKVYEDRVKFVKDIEEKYPPFHEMRRAIWPTFHLTYWLIASDQEIPIYTDKFYVATAYWGEDGRKFKTFSKEWEQEVSRNDGRVVLRMTEGISPLGYDYNPDRFTITEWPDRNTFEQFLAKNVAMDHEGVRHMNQFIIQ